MVPGRNDNVSNSKLKVVHAHDQGYVVKNLLRLGKDHGEKWFRVPPVYMGSTSIVAKFSSGGKFSDVVPYLYGSVAELVARFAAWSLGGVLHIHGGHLHQFCRRTKLPFILHIHGSEVRGFDDHGLPVKRISDGTLGALFKARAVAYSTPELGPILGTVVSDAVWVPAPVRILARENYPRTFDFADVFFPHVWMEDKSLHLLGRFIHQLRREWPGRLRFVGLDIGDRKDLGLNLGFELIPVADTTEHIRRMMSSKVVLAQPHGAAFGVSDVQAIASGSNFTPFPLQSSALSAYGYLESDQPSKSLSETLRHALAFLKNPNLKPEVDFEKILSKHSDDFVYGQLRQLYSKV